MTGLENRTRTSSSQFDVAFLHHFRTKRREGRNCETIRAFQTRSFEIPNSPTPSSSLCPVFVECPQRPGFLYLPLRRFALRAAPTPRATPQTLPRLQSRKLASRRHRATPRRRRLAARRAHGHKKRAVRV